MEFNKQEDEMSANTITTCPECGSDDLMFGVDEHDVEDGTFVCEDCDCVGGGTEYWRVNVVLPDGLQHKFGGVPVSGVDPELGAWFIDQTIDNVGVVMRVFGKDEEEMEFNAIGVLAELYGPLAAEWTVDDYDRLAAS